MHNIRENEKINRLEHLPSGYKKTKYGIYPIDWEVKKISEIFNRVRNPVNVVENQEYKQIGIRSHGKGIFYKDAIKGEKLGNKAVFWVEPDCFIVNIVFAWEMAVARTTKKELGYIASHRFPMYQPVKDVLDLDFITYFFKSPKGKHLLNLASPGGAGRNKTLGQKEFSEIEIIVPSNIKEQQKISEILFTWDKAIELKERLIEQKKERNKGLMQKMLTGELRLPGFKNSWEFKKVGDLIVESKEKAINPDLNKRITVRLNLKGVEKREVSNIEKEGATTQYIRKQGQFIYGKQNLHKGAFGLIPKELNGYQSSTDIPSFEFKNGVNAEWFYYYFSRENFYRNLENISSGTGSKRIQPKELFKIKIHFPSYEEQESLSEIFNRISNEISLHEKELAELKKQKQGLMQLLLTGKVRVKI